MVCMYHGTYAMRAWSRAGCRPLKADSFRSGRRRRPDVGPCKGLPGFEFELVGSGGGDLDGFAVFEIGVEDRGTGPFEVPSVLDGEDGVAAGDDVGEGEGAVAVALIAADEHPIVLEVLGNQQYHALRLRLAVAQHDALDAAQAAGDQDIELRAGASCERDAAAESFGASGGDGLDGNRVVLVDQSHFERSRLFEIVTNFEIAVAVERRAESLPRFQIAEAQEQAIGESPAVFQVNDASDGSDGGEALAGIDLFASGEIDFAVLADGTLGARRLQVQDEVSGSDAGDFEGAGGDFGRIGEDRSLGSIEGRLK